MAFSGSSAEAGAPCARTLETSVTRTIAFCPRAPSLESSSSSTDSSDCTIMARLTSASSSSASVSTPSRVTPFTDRNMRSAKCARIVWMAYGPTNERVSGRSVPPMPIRFTFGVSRAAIASITGRLFVMTVTPSPRSTILRATKYAVELESRKMVSRGESIWTASSARLALASVACSTRWAKESSCAEIDGRTAPPCVRRAMPWRSSSARSRRAVIGETPKRDSTSVTFTAPDSRSTSAIAARRAIASIGRSERLLTRSNRSKLVGFDQINATEGLSSRVRCPA